MNNQSKQWDRYFRTYIHPISSTWAIKDIQKHEQWYFNWMWYIQHAGHFRFKDKKVFELGSGAGGVCSLL